MRLVFALTTIVLLFWIGWDQSYQDHVANVLNGKPTPAEGRVTVRQNGGLTETEPVSTLGAPMRDNSWMWKKSKLDNPHEGKVHYAR
jgi:hypothetical protein